ncbi:methionine--tRNA ligase [Candidatus Woesearchaeota archaeon]|nr:methionine--tRNA ligase [Candidatus Woesearchaeota archaeon]
MSANKSARKVLVTAALPYANGPLHLGHMVEYVQADIFVRFLRLSGSEVAFVCASDAHGAPIEIAASKAGIKPEEIVKRYYDEHASDFRDFLVNFDIFYTTHSPENESFSDFFFNTLKKNGFIYDRLVEQAFCEHCRRFLPDRYVKGTCPKCFSSDQYGDGCEKCGSVYKPVEVIDARCAVCGAVPFRRSSMHYFFRLKSFSGKLREWIVGNKLLQSEIKNFVLSWIDSGLEDWDISRDGPYFGFRIPGEVNLYYYVWLDAPIGYIASTEKFAKGVGKGASDFWQSQGSEIIHFIGKDIIYFHLLFWPALLMGVGYNLPSDVVVHGHLTVGGEKMSKSRGNFFTVRDYLAHYDPELLRFYYASNLSKTSADINLDFRDFELRINSELVSNIANFIYRTLSFINNNLDSKIGKVGRSSQDGSLAAVLKDKFADVLSFYGSYNYREAVKTILEISSIGNKYLQDNMPWKLVASDRKRCSEVLAMSANIVKCLSVLLFPVMPDFCVKVQKQLGVEALSFADLDLKLASHSINRARIIFTPFEETPSLGKEKFPALLKVGVIESVEAHPSADKLYVLRVNLGSESRTLVAGLKAFYSVEELLNRKIIVVANLKPAVLRGVESQGMLLAADKDGRAVPLAVPGSLPGDSVFVEGMEPSEKQITVEQFHALGLSVESKRVFYGEKILRTAKEEVVADADNGSKVR